MATLFQMFHLIEATTVTVDGKPQPIRDGNITALEAKAYEKSSLDFVRGAGMPLTAADIMSADLDGDGRVTTAEAVRDRTNQLLFDNIDLLNSRDGVITATEAGAYEHCWSWGLVWYVGWMVGGLLAFGYLAFVDTDKLFARRRSARTGATPAAATAAGTPSA